MPHVKYPLKFVGGMLEEDSNNKTHNRAEDYAVFLKSDARNLSEYASDIRLHL